ncbi:MAG: hypothetical protein LQ340_003279 [Diploschistes diacapsis]|nr:MAG: hypothetical protein LQ340_003279 [Diploschistes diacapsis]
MASNDVRDILDVKVAEGPRPAKKQKLVVRRPDNISKEVFSLIGERMPPVVLQPETEKYQKKFKVTRKAQPWEWQAFTNPCRKDALVLHHWVKKLSVQPPAPDAPATPAEPRVEDVKSNTPRATGSHWAQYNHKVIVPRYNDELYEAQLKSDDWTREETDYLFQLVQDFDLRWILVADRYDYQPKETRQQPSDDSTAVTHTPKPRTMEDLKARYYTCASKALVVSHPPASMSEPEFEAYERMTKFDPQREATRKRLAEALLARSPEEIKEEETLLSELKRIVTNEERFLQERRELYSRLDYPVAQGSIAAYETSAGLNQLVQTLLHADKAKKRRSLTGGGGGGGDAVSSPAQGTPAGQATPSLQRDHRGSISGSVAGGSTTKKGSTAGTGAATKHQPRHLSAREEARFGVSSHERLGSGVSFRSGRVDKLILAKSTAQSQKLQAVIAQLGLPLRAAMPTARVCEEYELLIQAVHRLLDVRKLGEKTGNEIKVLVAQREMARRTKDGDEDEDEDVHASSAHQATSDNEADEDKANEDAGTGADAEAEAEDQSDADDDLAPAAEAGDGEEDVEESEAEEQVEEEACEDEDEDEDEDMEDAPSTKGMRSAAAAGVHKRSASVMSMASEKSSKRQRK